MKSILILWVLLTSAHANSPLKNDSFVKDGQKRIEAFKKYKFGKNPPKPNINSNAEKKSKNTIVSNISNTEVPKAPVVKEVVIERLK